MPAQEHQIWLHFHQMYTSENTSKTSDKDHLCFYLFPWPRISQPFTVHPTPRATFTPLVAGLPMMLYLPSVWSTPPGILSILQATFYYCLIFKEETLNPLLGDFYPLSVQPKDSLPCFLHKVCNTHKELWIWFKSFSGFINLECQRCQQQCLSLLCSTKSE